MPAGGEFVNLVCDYDAPLQPARPQSRDSPAAEALTWLSDRRPRLPCCRVLPLEGGTRPVDAHVDRDFGYYFPSREEMADVAWKPAPDGR